MAFICYLQSRGGDRLPGNATNFLDDMRIGRPGEV